MSARNLTVDWHGDVAVVRLDDPSTLNALTLAMVDSFAEALDAIERRARCMVVIGAGRAFCSGANLFGGMIDQEPGPDYDAGQAIETHLNPLMMRLRSLKVPWISAVRGAAAGGGASLALAADIVVASETAFFLQPFGQIGLVPDTGSSHLLIRTIGRPRAMELMLLGDRLPAQTALAWGLINRVVGDGELEAEALALAARLATGPASLGMIRNLAWSAIDADWPTVLAMERALQREAGQTADHHEGMAAFREKRVASFKSC